MKVDNYVWVGHDEGRALELVWAMQDLSSDEAEEDQTVVLVDTNYDNNVASVVVHIPSVSEPSLSTSTTTSSTTTSSTTMELSSTPPPTTVSNASTFVLSTYLIVILVGLLSYL